MRVRVGETYHVIYYAPFFVAHEQGFFAREGLEIETRAYGSNPALQADMDVGAVDVGIGGIMRSLVAFDRGESPVPVHFARVNDRDGFLLLGRSEAFDWGDLLDRRLIVFAEAPTPWHILRALLLRNGLGPDRVRVIADVPLAEVAAAFRSGLADFALTQAHVAADLLRRGDAVILKAMALEAGPLPYSSYYCSPAFLRDSEDALRPFVRAHVRALRWIARHSGEEVWEAIAPAFSDGDGELLASATRRYHALGTWNSDATLPRASYQRLADALRAGGLIARVPPYELVCNDLLAAEAEARLFGA